MVKQIVIGAFEELTPNFISNTWHHPRSNTKDFATLEYWQDMARRLDAGGFDFLFFAEAIGYPMSGDDIPDAVVREAVQFPVLDPMTIISGLAATVDRLGFVVTASTTAQQPYLNARAFTTLDHLTKGRVAWNIVTSDNQVGLVKLLGHGHVTPHDERYRRAQEFLDLSYKLWEQAWDDDAVIYDKENRTYADPAKVHRITHSGEYFSLDGIYPAPPSIQRTPLLLQAGTSKAGMAFAAQNAECVFIQERDDPAAAAATISRLRSLAAAHGREGAPKVIASISVIVADTEEEAHRLRAELDATPTREAGAALYLGWSGVDLMKFDAHSTLDDVTTEVGQTMLAMFQNGNESPTVGEVLDRISTAISGARFVGTPAQVADALAEYVNVTDIDGFLIENPFGGAEGYGDFIDKVMPLLRDKNMLPPSPRGGTMRERMTGSSSPRLPADHPALALASARALDSATV